MLDERASCSHYSYTKIKVFFLANNCLKLINFIKSADEAGHGDTVRSKANTLAGEMEKSEDAMLIL